MKDSEFLPMVAYTFYWIDEREKVHFIGLLPERRRNPERITKESVMNFGKTILDDYIASDKMFFIRVTVDEDTGEISWPKPSVGFQEAV